MGIIVSTWQVSVRMREVQSASDSKLIMRDVIDNM